MKPKTNRAGTTYVPQGYDACQTPPYALVPLLSYLDKRSIIWESACGEGLLLDSFRENGYCVWGTDLLFGQNFFTLDIGDVQVTNPPYSIKYPWLLRSFALKKPFALLLPVETLGAATAQRLFKTHGIEILLLSRRVNFKMPNLGYNGHGAQFPVAWFTHGLQIGRELTFVELER